jgi:ABC-type multidrug transport system ATPase subunit
MSPTLGMFDAAAADEISTGLDSSSITEITKLLSVIVKTFNSTAIISLLQPPPEVFNTFDDIILMREGEIVFHGAITSRI